MAYTQRHDRHLKYFMFALYGILMDVKAGKDCQMTEVFAYCLLKWLSEYEIIQLRKN